MSLIQKFFKGSKQKQETDITDLVGINLLTKLVAPELTKGGFLQQYGKSLYVFACISKIARRVATVPLQLYRIKNSRGDTGEIMTHPLLDVLYKANPYETRTEFWETTMINLKCTGEAYWWKIRNNGGKVVELWNLRPDLMEIVLGTNRLVQEYRFHKNDGTTESFPAEDIVHFKYPDPLSQVLGMSPLKPAAARVQTEEFATQYQRDFFLNSARPDAVIKNPKFKMTKEQKRDLRDYFEKQHRGIGKTSKVAILEGGLEYQLISISQKEMDFIESLKFTRDDILVAFGVPKPIVAVIDDVNRANSETAMQIFLSEVINPEMTRLVEKINEEMTYIDFGEDLFIDFPDQTPASRDIQLQEYREGIASGYLLINEVRQRENLPPVKGGWSIYMPLTQVPIGGLSSGDQGKAASKGMIMAGADTKEEAYETMPEAKAKHYDFKGRYWLKQKFELAEAMEKAVAGAIKNASKNKKAKKNKKKNTKSATSLLTGDTRKAYGEVMLKTIDRKTEQLSAAVNKFADEQKGRVLAKLNEKKSVKNKFKITSIFDVEKEAKIAGEMIIPFIEQFIKDAGQEALNMLAPQEDFTDSKNIQKKIQKRAAFFAKTVNSTTLQKLDGTLSEGIAAGEGIRDLSSRVEDVYSEFPAYRSELVARTEATHANNEGTLEGYRQSDVANGKEWIATLDDRTRESHVDLNGEIVGVDEEFSNGLDYPGADGPAEEVINCRCVLGPAFIEE